MDFFSQFDEDKLTERVRIKLKRALSEWAAGVPMDECALMNQITGQFNRKRAQQCDIGKEGIYTVRSEVFEWHRKGPKQSDEFGSDLAVTVETPGFTKTAFFQFKVSKLNKARIAARQIAEAKLLPEVFDRAFVFAVDRETSLMRLNSLQKLEREVAGQATKEFDTGEWEGLTEWLISWFRCQRGKPSEPGDVTGVESLLKRHTTRRPRLVFRRETGTSEPLPAKAWLKTTIEPNGA